MTAPTNFARIVVPETFGGATTESSYLRLGRYIQPDESAITTGLSTTTENASPETSDNNGILIYTKDDLNEMVAGKVLQKYGAGLTTVVTTADASCTVEDGDYVVTVTGDILLTASGHIKQVAHGPLDEWTHGDTNKKMMGASNEIILGAKDGVYLGTVNSFTLGLTTTVFVGRSFSLRIADDTSIFIGRRTSVELSGRFIITVGAAFTFVAGVSTNYVMGPDSKIVLGISSKEAVSDTKILETSDFKIAPVSDAKKVGINMTVCEIDFKKELIDDAGAYSKNAKTLFKTATAQMKVEGGGQSSTMFGLINMM